MLALPEADVRATVTRQARPADRRAATRGLRYYCIIGRRTDATASSKPRIDYPSRSAKKAGLLKNKRSTMTGA